MRWRAFGRTCLPARLKAYFPCKSRGPAFFAGLFSCLQAVCRMHFPLILQAFLILSARSGRAGSINRILNKVILCGVNGCQEVKLYQLRRGRFSAYMQ